MRWKHPIKQYSFPSHTPCWLIPAINHHKRALFRPQYCMPGLYHIITRPETPVTLQYGTKQGCVLPPGGERLAGVQGRILGAVISPQYNRRFMGVKGESRQWTDAPRPPSLLVYINVQCKPACLLQFNSACLILLASEQFISVCKLIRSMHFSSFWFLKICYSASKTKKYKETVSGYSFQGLRALLIQSDPTAS